MISKSRVQHNYERASGGLRNDHVMQATDPANRPRSERESRRVRAIERQGRLDKERLSAIGLEFTRVWEGDGTTASEVFRSAYRRKWLQNGLASEGFAVWRV